jgi:hypothetical protein
VKDRHHFYTTLDIANLIYYNWYMNSKWTQPANELRLIEAVKSEKSIAAVCRSLGLKDIGGNYSTIKHHIVRLNLDISHHTGQGWNKDNFKEPQPNNLRKTIRLRLIRDRGHECENCKLCWWMGQPIMLEMDHIDGNNSNNIETNLRLLCPNCHSQTSTWRNRTR